MSNPNIEANKAIRVAPIGENGEFFNIDIEGNVGVVIKSQADLEGGGKISVGTTAIEATFTGITTTIIISADKNNTGTLFVGASDVDDAGANALGFLSAGDTMEIDYDDSVKSIYVVSDTAGQNFWKGALIV